MPACDNAYFLPKQSLQYPQFNFVVKTGQETDSKILSFKLNI
jgi:hypothetical protein